MLLKQKGDQRIKLGVVPISFLCLHAKGVLHWDGDSWQETRCLSLIPLGPWLPYGSLTSASSSKRKTRKSGLEVKQKLSKYYTYSLAKTPPPHSYDHGSAFHHLFPLHMSFIIGLNAPSLTHQNINPPPNSPIKSSVTYLRSRSLFLIESAILS